MREFTIGCDPELFVRSLVDDEFVSAHDLIPGTKEKPYVVPGGAILVDGTALEFNTDPASSFVEFEENIDMVLTDLYDRVEGGVWSDNYITYEPTAIFNKKYFDALPDFVKELGCMPDFNAYTSEENTPPSTSEPFRTAGGHIHIGWGEFLDLNDPDHIMECRDAVRQLDAVLFPASMTWDKDEKRRSLYGQKGSFRPKTYGVEYRPLSCKWLSDRSYVKFVYEATVQSLDMLFNKGIKLYD